jgi:hypothetical protein
MSRDEATGTRKAALCRALANNRTDRHRRGGQNEHLKNEQPNGSFVIDGVYSSAQLGKIIAQIVSALGEQRVVTPGHWRCNTCLRARGAR